MTYFQDIGYIGNQIKLSPLENKLFAYLNETHYATDSDIMKAVYGGDDEYLKVRYNRLIGRLNKKIELIGKVSSINDYKTKILTLNVNLTTYKKR